MSNAFEIFTANGSVTIDPSLTKSGIVADLIRCTGEACPDIKFKWKGDRSIILRNKNHDKDIKVEINLGSLLGCNAIKKLTIWAGETEEYDLSPGSIGICSIQCDYID